MYIYHAHYGLSLGPFLFLHHPFQSPRVLYYHMYHLMTHFLLCASIPFYMTRLPFRTIPFPSNPRTRIIGLPASCIVSGGALKPSTPVYKDACEDQVPYLGLLDNCQSFSFHLYSYLLLSSISYS